MGGTKLGRMEIPKSEEDLQKLTEEIMKEETEEVAGHERGYAPHEHHAHTEAAGLDEVVHQLIHMYESILYAVQALREIRDSLDIIASNIKRSSRALALAVLLSQTQDPESKRKLVELLSKELGIDEIKNLVK